MKNDYIFSAKLLSRIIILFVCYTFSNNSIAQAYIEINDYGWGEGLGAAKPAVCDIDGDGLIDLLSGNKHGKVLHFEQGIVGDTSFYLITNDFNGIDMVNFAAPTITDIDGDGLLDLIVGKHDGKLVHYEQTNNQSLDFALITNFFNNIDIGEEATPVFIDVDNDSCLDLFIGEYQGNVNHYEQNEPYSSVFNFVTHSFNNIDIGERSAPAFTDLNYDGKLDLFIGEENGKINHYSQQEENSYTFKYENDFDYMNFDAGTAPIFTDLDSDGFIDMLIGDASGNIKLYEQSGNPNSEIFYEASTFFNEIDVGEFAAPIVYDIDSDGFFDMIIGKGDGKLNHYVQSADDPDVFYLVNSIFNEIDVGAMSAPCLIDIDNDNLLDLIIGSFDYGSIWHYEQLNENSLVFTLVTENFINTMVSFTSPFIIDVDNNDLLDLFIGNSFSNRIIHAKQTEENTYNFSIVTDHFEDIIVSPFPKPNFSDFDDDGVLELLIGDDTGTIYLYEQISADTTGFEIITPNFLNIDVGNASAPFITDFNNDGRKDLLIGTMAGTIYHYKQYDLYNSLEIVSNSICKGINQYGTHSKPCFYDINNNGLMDLLVGNSEGRILHYEQSYTDSLMYELIDENFNNIDVGSRSAPVIADIDNDGLLDLIIGEQDGIINVYKQETVDFYIFNLQEGLLSDIDVGFNSTPTITDIDGDGLLNLLIGESLGNINHFEQGIQNPWLFVEISNSFNGINVGNGSTPFVCDIDRDGILDLLIGETSGNLNHFIQNDTNSTNFTEISTNYENVNVGASSAPFAMDLNGDEIIDLVLGEAAGGLHLFINFCTQLINPIDETTEMVVLPTFTWSTALNSEGYLLNLGTDNPPTNFYFREELGPDTSYTLQETLEYNQTYYWSIEPYNVFDTANACDIYSFKTQTLIEISDIESFSDCAFPSGWSQETLISGLEIWSLSSSNNAGGEACELAASPNIGKGISRLISPMINTSGLTELSMEFDQYYEDLGTSGLSISIESSNDGINWIYEDWNINSGSGNIGPEKATVNITNNLGGKTQVSFTLSGNHSNFSAWFIDNVTFFDASLPPGCTNPVFPENKATDVSLFTHLKWNSAGNTDGYRLYFGTDNPPTNIENGTDLGNVLSYVPLENLIVDTTYYWRIIPYNENGDAIGCSVLNFSTKDLNPPENLEVEYNSPNVEITWQRPDDPPPPPPPPGGWLHYDDGINYDGLGLNSGGTFWGAARWDPTALSQYDSYSITQFRFFPRLFINETEFIFMIWEGTNAETLVYEQQVYVNDWNEWNLIDLAEPHAIDASRELWVGFKIIHPASEFPLGYDGGPAVEGYGDMILIDGYSWEPLSSYGGFDYNFNIQVFIAEDSKGINKQKIPARHTANITSRGSFNYNIYRNDTLLNAVPIDTAWFVDENVSPGYQSYTVKAVYDYGLSNPAGPVEVLVPYSEPTILVDTISFTFDTVAGAIIYDTFSISNLGNEQLSYIISLASTEKNNLNHSKNLRNTLCVENLYSSGCGYGDGLISWSLENINVPVIPCVGSPEWYHDYHDQVHNLVQGDYDLTVTAGYGSTNFDVWIDFNDDLLFTENELVIDDAICIDSNVPYTFTLTVPVGAEPGEHIMRFRTNWIDPVNDPCETYSYGNCVDFSAMVYNPVANDVGITSIDMTTLAEPGMITPLATVTNFGIETQSFDAMLTIGNYSSTVNVAALVSGASQQVSFEVWDATTGTFNVEACTYLAEDENNTNDCKTKEIVVEPSMWLSVEPRIGNLMFQDEIQHQLSIDVPYVDGLHLTEIMISSNDQNNPILIIPVELNVFVPLEARFEADALVGFPPFEVTFADMSYGNPLTWEWDFENDGIIDSWEQNPTWVFEEFGKYDIKLIITENEETDTLIKYNYINVNFLNESVITSINDIPNDQGGWVMVDFTKSVHDTDSLQEWDEMYNVEMNEGSGWINAGTVGAYASNYYAVQVHTSFDSSQYNNGLIDFRVIAIMQEGNFASDTIQGYSVDNLVPQAPADFMGYAMNEQLHFNWSEPVDEDFQYFAVYKSDASGEFPDEPYQTTIINGISDEINLDDQNYIVTAIDFNGNESNASQIISAQSIQLTAGWVGISAYVYPSYPEIENVFEVLSDELIILQNMTGVYWPAQGINTLGNWDYNSGYYLKTNGESTLPVIGQKVAETTLSLAEGWNLIPVLSAYQPNVAELFEGQDVIIVKEVAGTNLYWPEMNINTLGHLQPGKAYFVLIETAGEITFPDCIPEMKAKPAETSATFTLLKEYNVAATPNTHIIAMDASALFDFDDLENWVITTCDAEGHCYGAGYLADNFISLFGDDPTTEVKDGFMENDPVQIRVVNEKTGVRYSCEVDYDFTWPNHDGLFETNGLSVISNLKLSPLNIDEVLLSAISIYPNPAKDEITIQSNLVGELDIEIIDQLGNVLLSKHLTSSNQKVDVSAFAPGVYLINLKTEQTSEIRKLVIK